VTFVGGQTLGTLVVMSRTQSPPSIPGPFAERDPAIGKLYAAFVRAARTAAPGPVVEDAKKTCVHLNAGKGGSAFAGVHPRKAGLLVTVKSVSPIESPRIRKVLAASSRRYYCDLLIEAESDLDAELGRWLAASYSISVAKEKS
jgi:hypothetical protein